MIDEYIKPYDKLYGPTYLVLDILQKVFYTTNAAREAFVELCASDYVQRVTFNSYLYKKVCDDDQCLIMMINLTHFSLPPFTHQYFHLFFL